ncbi:type II toxin-antitoxin system prevent-host-death family antitoxin [Streptomyces sp. XY332]|uniref:type II toxin-antitoxin system prevent-host-death family antitoxin n=1 Tax=Streptomyces sp. XY332 TaxID=1415561 RepID=UPI002D2192E1|nr:type II toxin-antitoxin system prevent-host-death family antitoxin [Streptomyces sp. XY332]
MSPQRSWHGRLATALTTTLTARAPAGFEVERETTIRPDARNRLLHVRRNLDRADRDDVPTVITRRGKEVAAVVSIEVLRKYQEWEEREINRIIDERTANPAPGIPIEDVMGETLARGE